MLDHSTTSRWRICVASETQSGARWFEIKARESALVRRFKAVESSPITIFCMCFVVSQTYKRSSHWSYSWIGRQL